MNLPDIFTILKIERYTGVKFNNPGISNDRQSAGPRKFCEAVCQSFDSAVVLHATDIDCIGAKRAFGLYRNDRQFASLISQETNIPAAFISEAIKEIPVLDTTFQNVEIGLIDDPEVIIALVKPATITKLIKILAEKFRQNALVSPYFFMSVCGNVAVRTYHTKRVCISFGCPEARKDDRVRENELIVGFPKPCFEKN